MQARSFSMILSTSMSTCFFSAIRFKRIYPKLLSSSSFLKVKCSCLPLILFLINQFSLSAPQVIFIYSLPSLSSSLSPLLFFFGIARAVLFPKGFLIRRRGNYCKIRKERSLWLTIYWSWGFIYYFFLLNLGVSA